MAYACSEIDTKWFLLHEHRPKKRLIEQIHNEPIHAKTNLKLFLISYERRSMSRRPQAYPMPAHILLIHHEVKLFATSSDSFFIRLARAAFTHSGEKPNSLAAHAHRPVILPVARTMVKDGLASPHNVHHTRFIGSFWEHVCARQAQDSWSFREISQDF